MAAVTAGLLAAIADSIGLGLIDLRPHFHAGVLGASLTTLGSE